MKNTKHKQASHEIETPATEQVAVFHTTQDVKDAVLIVSLLVNLFVLCLWIALQVTTSYDSSLVSFFLNR